MPTNEFQELVRLIEQSLHSKNAKVTCPAFVKGQGLDKFREVDVLIEDEFGPHRIKVAVEATVLGRKMGIGTYDRLVKKYRGEGRVAVDIFIIVTKLGYTEDVLEKALLEDVELVTLDKAKESYWPAMLGRSSDAWSSYPAFVCTIGFTPPLPKGLVLPNLREVPLRCSHGNDMGKAADFVMKWLRRDEGMPDQIKKLDDAAKKSPKGIAHAEGQIDFRPDHAFVAIIGGSEYPVQGIWYRLHKECHKGTGTTTCFNRLSTKGPDRQMMYMKAEAKERSLEIAMELKKQGDKIIFPEQITVRWKDPLFERLKAAQKQKIDNSKGKSRKKKKR